MKGLAKTYFDMQKFRVGLENTLSHPHCNHPFLKELCDHAKGYEETLEEICGDLVKSEDIYIAFLSKIKGIGPVMAAYIIDYFDIYKADHVSSFWLYSGLAPGCKRTKGKKIIYNPTLKSIILGRLFKQLMMARGYYYELFKKFRVEIEKQHPDWTKGKIFARARLKTMKKFECDLWVIWRELRNLPVTKPYAVEKMGHSYIPLPPLPTEPKKKI
jgi:hypothetical protein